MSRWRKPIRFLPDCKGGLVGKFCFAALPLFPRGTEQGERIAFGEFSQITLAKNRQNRYNPPNSRNQN
jgi:hypothetical protein